MPTPTIQNNIFIQNTTNPSPRSAYFRPFYYLITLAIYGTIVYYLYKKNLFKIPCNYPLITFIVVIFFGVFLLLLLYSSTIGAILKANDMSRNISSVVFNPLNPQYNVSLRPLMTTLLITLGVFVGSISLFFLTNYVVETWWFTYIIWGLTAVFGVGLLYLLVRGFMNRRNSTTHVPLSDSFFVNLFRYLISCSFSDLWSFLVKEYTQTSRTTFIILLIEIAVGLILIFRESIRDFLFQLLTHNSKLLLDESEPLDQRQELATYQELYPSSSPSTQEFHYNYGISFWFYINPLATEDQYFTILSQGRKPSILYNQNKNRLKVLVSTSKDKCETVLNTDDVKTQRWNHCVVNYTSGTMDIFMNDSLVATKHTQIPYMFFDSIVAGQENGIQGGIRSVRYFKHPLSKSEIGHLYTFEKKKS